MGQYDDDECMLPISVHHDVAKHGCDHLDAVNRICTYLKKRLLAIHASRFVVDNTIEDVLICDAASSVAAVMVSEQSPCCCKYHRTVRADTCCLADDPDSGLRAHDVAACHKIDMWVTCLPSRLLVIRGR
ncbi:hypothetical protein TNCV_3588161 [Trichonephila clavipes]|nr:hypothetical protein TNCV_3588161 [Trichonephila clavipes]